MDDTLIPGKKKTIKLSQWWYNAAKQSSKNNWRVQPQKEFIETLNN